jgi:hypothetical protein
MTTKAVVISATLIVIVVLEVVAIAVVLVFSTGTDLALWLVGTSALAAASAAGRWLYKARKRVGSHWLQLAILTNPILSLVLAGVALIAHVSGMATLGALAIYVLVGLQIFSLACFARYLQLRVEAARK